MANWNNRWEDNTGPLTPRNETTPYEFYVDKECVHCSICADASPNCFRPSDDGSHAICYMQPGESQDWAQCMEAMENCPFEAIGWIGESTWKK